MNQLEILRESLGQCDEIILDALIMRNRIVEDIMAYKEANGLQILQPEQEAKQKEWLEKRMEGRRHKDEVSDVFECIRTNSKRIQARKLFNYNIVLIGFMGAGKSTISDFLKNVFAMDVAEMDQIIAQRQGMSISDIFETYARWATEGVRVLDIALGIALFAIGAIGSYLLVRYQRRKDAEAAAKTETETARDEK